MLLHKWIVEYRDAAGVDKAGNAHTQAGAQRLAAERLRDGAQWATYRKNN